MRDATVLEQGAGEVVAWLAKLAMFGVPPEDLTLVVPEDEVGEVRRFDE
jgi:hypothetical protein